MWTRVSMNGILIHPTTTSVSICRIQTYSPITLLVHIAVSKTVVMSTYIQRTKHFIQILLVKDSYITLSVAFAV